MRPLVPIVDPLVLGGGAVAVLLLVLCVVFVRLRRARRRGAAEPAAPEASTLPLSVSAPAEEAAGPPVHPVRDPGLAELPARYHALLRRGPAIDAASGPARSADGSTAEGADAGHPVAADRPGRPVPQAPVTPEPVGPRALQVLPASPVPSGDARDRLLAVLVADPGHAVQAVRDLQACERQLDRLSAAVRHEKATLSGVLRRLSAAGLDRDQLARLTGLPPADVHDLLAGAPEAVGAP